MIERTLETHFSKDYRKPDIDPFGIENSSSLATIPKVGFQEAIDFLTDLGAEFLVLSQYHIRISHINYYPSRGTVFCDGATGKYKGKGLKFLEQVLFRERILK